MDRTAIIEGLREALRGVEFSIELRAGTGQSSPQGQTMRAALEHAIAALGATCETCQQWEREPWVPGIGKCGVGHTSDGYVTGVTAKDFACNQHQPSAEGE